MSFTTEVKNEIASLDFTSLEVLPFLSGFVRNNIKSLDKDILLTTENPKIARIILSLLKSTYDISPILEQSNGTNFNKKKLYTIKILEKKEEILKDLNVCDSSSNYLNYPKEYLIDSEDQIRSYLRGVFLENGSINDPKTSKYHLEFLVSRKEETDLIIKLLSTFNITAKSITREKGYMVYLKEAEKIGDFLRVLSANKSVMYFEDIRIYRDHKNMTNRLNNCEQANVDKIIATSEKQIKEINFLIDKLGLDLIDEKLKVVMEYRRKYKEVSLDELAKIISIETEKNLTKSGLNHRFRKIHEMVENIKKNNN